MNHPEIELVIGKVVPWAERGRLYRYPPEPQMFVHCQNLDALPVREHNAALDIARSLEESAGEGILEGWPPEDGYCHVWRVYVRFRLDGPRRFGDVSVGEWRSFRFCSPDGAFEVRQFASRLREEFRKRSEARAHA